MSDLERVSVGPRSWILLPALDLTDIGHYRWPGRGDTYYLKIAGHDIQLYLTEKRKKVRVFVDHVEWIADVE